jgi:NAD(P)-dependent dehydrogenase (short-subunit alcohol dehydrogenase family)
MSGNWDETCVSDQSGKTVVITGGNAGLGWETGRVLAGRGAHVVLACRNLKKGVAAADRMRALSPASRIDMMQLDVADLASVRAFAAAFSARFSRIDILCNNAGVMAIPFGRTVDGFETQFATNHLGHFALTGRVLDLLARSPHARIISVSSHASRIGTMRFDDLHGERAYGPWSAYGQSKLANLLFTRELTRRLRATHPNVIAVACHPGYSATDLQLVAPRVTGSKISGAVIGLGNRLLAQTAAMGALPTLYAAVADEVRGGDYIGPNGFMEWRGFPKKVAPARRATRDDDAQRLWELSSELTRVSYLAPSSGEGPREGFAQAG